MFLTLLTLLRLLVVDVVDLQLDSEKCTGRYFNVRDDDLSSKQGSLGTLKNIFFSISINLNIFIFVIKLKHNMNIFFVNSIDR